jgi:circadian clock protein KaiB
MFVLPATPRIKGTAHVAIKPGTRFKLRLYISGEGPNSLKAQANLQAICNAHFDGMYDIEVVDLLVEPLRGLSDRIRMTPTLIKCRPEPETRIVGALGDPKRVLLALGDIGTLE